MTMLRVATWNVHGAVGLDRRCDPARIARVVAELDADVVALQEAWWARGRTDDLLAQLAEAAEARAVFAPTFDKRGQPFGNALLSRLPLVGHDIVDLAIGRREPRNAIDATLDVGGARLRVVATHLGLGAAERRLQAARLVECIRADATPCILLGDFNALRTPRAFATLQAGRAPPTFPSALPIAPLDRILARPATLIRESWVHATRAARIASDHRPLLATIEFARP